jgi:hypothetical protein
MTNHADFIETSIHQMERMTSALKACMERLNDQQVWEKHGDHENAAGNLVLHLCGNMRQWIMHGVGGAQDVRTRDAEFCAKDGHTPAQLIELFCNTVNEAKSVIRSVSAERSLERIRPQGRDVTVLEAIYQVVCHVHHHVGQIILLTKQMTAKDLDLTIPRPR